MTTAPVPRLIRGLAVPTIISMLVTSFYVMADTYFVGKINTQSTAAVGISFSIMAIIQAFGFFCGHGSGNFISRRLGARDYRSAEKMAATGFFSAFLIGCAIALVGLLFLDPICRALGSIPTILPYAKTYLGIILLGAPFMASSLVLNNQMRFQGNAVYAMIGIIVGAVLNIGLDPLLIFVFDMGIAGAAWSTFISQVCSFTILLFMDRKGENIRIHYRHFTPTPAYLKEIVYYGAYNEAVFSMVGENGRKALRTKWFRHVRENGLNISKRFFSLHGLTSALRLRGFSADLRAIALHRACRWG